MNQMKRLTSLLLVGLLMVTGCGNQKAEAIYTAGTYEVTTQGFGGDMSREELFLTCGELFEKE